MQNVSKFISDFSCLHADLLDMCTPSLKDILHLRISVSARKAVRWPAAHGQPGTALPAICGACTTFEVHVATCMARMYCARLTNSVYLPQGQVCRNQEHLLRQINLVGLNRHRERLACAA